MSNTIVVKGRLIDAKTVELDEPVRDVAVDVQVVVQPISSNPKPQFANLADFLRTLPVGTRTREDIDRQIAEERVSWGDEP